jgi:hypothetical protein
MMKIPMFWFWFAAGIVLCGLVCLPCSADASTPVAGYTVPLSPTALYGSMTHSGGRFNWTPLDGVVPNWTPPDGMKPNRTLWKDMSNWTPRDGMMPNGTPHKGMMLNWTPSDEMMLNRRPPDGMMPNGTPPKGMLTSLTQFIETLT